MPRPRRQIRRASPDDTAERFFQILRGYDESARLLHESIPKLKLAFTSLVVAENLCGSYEHVISIMCKRNYLVKYRKNYILNVSGNWVTLRKVALDNNQLNIERLSLSKGGIMVDPEELNDSAVAVNTQKIIFLTVTNTRFEPRDLLDITIHNSIETSQRTCFHLVETLRTQRTLHINEPHRVNIKFHPTRVGVFKAIIMFHFNGFTMNRFITGRSCHDMSLVQELQPTTPYVRPDRRSLVSMAREDDDVIIETPEPEEKNQLVQKKRRRLQTYLYPKEFAVKRKSGQLSEYLDSLKSQMTNKRHYMEYMQCLLWSEELQQSNDILQYSMKNVTMEITPHLLRIQVPGLAENRPSVMKGDTIHIKYSIRGNRPNKIYVGEVKEVERLAVLMRFSKHFHYNYSTNRDCVDVEFQLNRKTMRLCHQAVNALNNISGDYFKLMLFPSIQDNHTINSDIINTDLNTIISPNILPHFLPLVEQHTLNLEQRLAVYQITNGKEKEPYIIFGPPGTGKTSTVVGAITHMAYNQMKKKILVCTPSNSSADLIVERLHHKGISTTHMFRHMAYSRSRDTVSDIVLPYCHFDMKESAFVFPALDVFHKYSIIITTCAMASSLYNDMVSSNYFDYVFIDESGQCTEPEVLGCFIHTLKQFGGKLILAGDPKQLGPVIHSPIARNSGLDQSLLVRLTDDPSPSNIYKRYDNGYDYHEEETNTHTMLHYNPRYIVKLVQCYRCHPEILYVPNTLFYNRDLVSSLSHNAPAYAFNNWSECINESTHFPILFDCIIGEEMQENNSPSWFNIAEIDSVLYYIDLILQTSPTTTMSDIGIITPYQKQVQKIKQALRQKYGTTQADMISVGSCEQFQGQERKVIIISTVRSSTQHLITDETFNIGFLSNPRRFNVAVTRAQGLLIVIGNPYMLIQDECWGSLLRHCMNNQSVYNLPSDVLTRKQDVAESNDYINTYNSTNAATTTDNSTTPNNNEHIQLLRDLLQSSREMNNTNDT